MSSHRSRSPRSAQQPEATAAERASHLSAFDRWLRRQLRRIYRDAGAEPTPDHLQELVDQFPSRSEREGEAENSQHGEKRRE